MSDAGPEALVAAASAGSTATTAFLDAFTNLHHPHRLVEDNHTRRGRRVPRRLLPHRRPDRPGARHDRPGRRRRTRRRRSSATSRTAPCTRRCTARRRRPRTPPRPLRRRLGRDPGRRATSASSSSGCSRRARQLPPRNSRGRRRRRRRGTTSSPDDQAPLRPVHGGVRGDGRQRRPERRAGSAPASTSSASLDDTIFVFLSDNGASREGEAFGHVGVLPHAGLEEREGHRGPRGRPRAASTCSADRRRWCTTRAAGRWRRTRRGGSTRSTRTPAATRCRSSASWPNGGDAVPAGERRDQWAFVTDVLPTLLELTGVDAADDAQRRRAAAADRHARCVPVLRRRRRRRTPTASSTSRWPATAATTATAGRSSPATEPLTAFGDHEWELYDLAADRDRAARPRRRAPRAGGRAGGRLGGRRPGRTRCTRSTRAPGSATSCGRPTRSRSRSRCGSLRRHPHARALPVAAADPVAVVHRRRRAAPSAPATPASLVAHGDQGGGYALVRRRRATSWSSCTTATAR